MSLLPPLQIKSQCDGKLYDLKEGQPCGQRTYTPINSIFPQGVCVRNLGHGGWHYFADLERLPPASPTGGPLYAHVPEGNEGLLIHFGFRHIELRARRNAAAMPEAVPPVGPKGLYH